MKSAFVRIIVLVVIALGYAAVLRMVQVDRLRAGGIQHIDYPGLGLGVNVEEPVSAMLPSAYVIIRPPTLATENTSVALYELGYLFFGRESEQACIDEVRIRSRLSGYVNILQNGPFCKTVTAQDEGEVHGDRKLVSGKFPLPALTTENGWADVTNQDLFLYPFDQLQSTFGIQIQYRLISGDTTTTITALPMLSLAAIISPNWINDASGLQTTMNIVDINTQQPGDFGEWGTVTDNVFVAVSHKTYRPTFPQVFSVLLIVIPLILTLMSAGINDTNNFLQIAIALLAGTFGLRQLLAPGGLSYYIMIDYAMLGLYFLIGLSIILHILSKMNWRTRNMNTTQPPTQLPVQAVVPAPSIAPRIQSSTQGGSIFLGLLFIVGAVLEFFTRRNGSKP